MDKPEIGGILHRTDLAEIGLMSIPNRPGIAGTLLEALGERHVSVRFIVQCIDPQDLAHVLFCVLDEDLERALPVVEEVRAEMGAGQVSHQDRVAMVSIFGPEFQERPGLAGAMFSALAKGGIDIRAISTSIATVSCLVEIDLVEDALLALHDAFDISPQWQI